jgi:hypothetical protein
MTRTQHSFWWYNRKIKEPAGVSDTVKIECAFNKKALVITRSVSEFSRQQRIRIIEEFSSHFDFTIVVV